MLCLEATHSTPVTSLEFSCGKSARGVCQPLRSKLGCPRQIRSSKRVRAASSTGSSILQHQSRGQKAAISLDNVGVAFETERKRKQVSQTLLYAKHQSSWHALRNFACWTSSIRICWKTRWLPGLAAGPEWSLPASAARHLSHLAWPQWLWQIHSATSFGRAPAKRLWQLSD